MKKVLKMNYKQRLLQEYAELIEKTTRLKVYIEEQEEDLHNSPDPLLYKQFDSMTSYQSVLHERLEKALG